MENDTINYYLFYNEDGQVLMFYDRKDETYLYPQKVEKTLDETFEDRFYKLNMSLKEKSTSNDTMIYIGRDKVYTRKFPFMSQIFEIINIDDVTTLETYNGEYKLMEYSEGRYLCRLSLF